ncbi:MAG TPA: error-prone DNA polymerase, partial [Terriglobales bacterium]|nr:error-prone DNA polymerase [Terriglobales bacterium]
MKSMALLDRDGVYGSARFHLAAEKLGLKAHIGAEITMRGSWPAVRGPKSTIHVPLLCRDRTGYQNLCRLVTRMKARGPKNCDPVVTAATLDDLREYSEGFICLTGDERGPIAAALRDGGYQAARGAVFTLTEIYGRENVYVELQRHFDREEESRNQAAIAIARELDLPLIATNGVSYAVPERRQILDVLSCIRNHVTLDAAGRLLAQNSERHIKSPQEMERMFADLPEAIANTEVLSSRIEFKLSDLGYEFPKYPVPAGHTINSYLRKLCREGEDERYLKATDELRERAHQQIERELALIEKLDLAGYFIIVWDIIRFCRKEDILVQGRGSAANSAVCYALGITAVDPVKMELLFERFLSEERGEWPDIDLDLPSGDQRERVIQYVYQRYGRLGAAMTANVITYRGRLAAREIGKAMGFDNETLGRLASVVGSWEYKGPQDTLERQFRDAGFDLRHPRMRKFVELAVAVQDLPRHLGQHSGGMVICQGQLDSVVPLEPASMPDRVVVQWDKEDCADMGIIKVDLLGLGMMAVLEDCLDLIPPHYGEVVDLALLPADDEEVFSTLRKADTVGMFQVESRAQMSCLPRLRPVKFYDIVVQVALIRPGPIVGEMVNPYIRRRQNKEEVSYAHPSLEPILKRTLGVPLFQEQLIRIAMVAANFTGGQAEELRRAFGFKRSEARMRDIEVKLREGMAANGILGETQDQIIHSITSFALYGFPESHAASFALLAYASAFLKCHYLAAFTAAMLNNQPMGFYHPSTLVKDAQRHGLKMRPIDIVKSDYECTLEPDLKHESRTTSHDPFVVRLGLNYVRGMRAEVARAIVAERDKAPFHSIADLVRRVPGLRKNELVILADIGALNNIGSTGANGLKLHRRDALWQVERAAREAGPLLEGIQELDQNSPLAMMSNEERLVADFRGTGLTVGPHPMTYHRADLNRRGVRPAMVLPKMRNGVRVKTAGCVIARQRPGTAHGFVFLSLEDETGIANAIVTPDLFEKNRLLLVSERFLLVEGILQNVDNVVSVKADRVLPLVVTDAQTNSHDFH